MKLFLHFLSHQKHYIASYTKQKDLNLEYQGFLNKKIELKYTWLRMKIFFF